MAMIGRASAGRRGVWVRLLGMLAIALAAMAAPAAAERPGPLRLAAVGDGGGLTPETDSGLPSDPLVERIQRGLAQAGLYSGRFTRMNSVINQNNPLIFLTDFFGVELFIVRND